MGDLVEILIYQIYCVDTVENDAEKFAILGLSDPMVWPLSDQYFLFQELTNHPFSILLGLICDPDHGT